MLETERLIINVPTFDDLEVLYAIHSNPDNQKYNPNGPERDIEIFKQSLIEWINHHNKYGFGYYTLVDKQDHQLFGVCGLKYKLLNDQTYLNIYYRINSNKARQGFVKEAANKIIQHVNQKTNHKYPLVAQTKKDNIPSIRTAQSLGFKMDSMFDDVLEKGNVFLFR